MADNLGEHSSTEAAPPNHLGTNVPSGQFDGNGDPEKQLHHDNTPAFNEKKQHVDDDEEEDEDIDAIIADLESLDGHDAQAEEEEEVAAGEERPIAEEFLQTDTRQGLSEHEVNARRKKFGLNQMKEEKENLILKFLGYFVGPIQFVMEASNFSMHSPVLEILMRSYSIDDLTSKYARCQDF